MRILASLLFIAVSASLSAQNSMPGFSTAEITYSGTVVDSETAENIPFASVTMFERKTDLFITGTSTGVDGSFEIKTDHKDLYIEVGFLGYNTIKIEDYTIDNNLVALGRLALIEEGQSLDEVIVTADRSTTEFKTDRRVFNVGADLTSSGASALEVLNNVPSVNVDIEGSVTLRGSSGVQLLLNGKPSVLADEESGTLGNITAEMIEKIEVITNPSAKYEAEGTAGIINIVLKKNDKKALNGSISLNTGTPANHSVGVSLNKRTENFNLFTQLGVGFKERISDNTNSNTNFSSRSSINSTGTEERNEGYYNIVLGADYYLNPLNVITLSGSYTFEFEDQPSLTEFAFTDNFGTTQWTRTEVTDAGNPKLQYDLQYKREFKDNKEHTLAFSAIGNYFAKDQSSEFTEALVVGERDLTDQLTETNFKEGKFTFNLDYAKPLANNFSIESGAQYVDNTVRNDYRVQDLIDGTFITDLNLTNLFEYNQDVLGVYTTGAYEGDTWGVKLGARLEHTDLSTLLTNTGESNNQKFLDLFPSGHASYKVSDRISLQAGYSRRIYRPRLWDLNPFFNIRNNFSVRAGNPLLNPEYTDSYEIGSVFIYENISFNINLYQRFTTEKIERITTNMGNVTVFSPQNVGTSDIKGIEVNFKYNPINKVTFNGDFNYNLFKREGQFQDQEFDFSNNQWSTKITSKYKVNKQFDFEVTGRYESSEQTVQGMRSSQAYMDFGVRYKILYGKVVLNASIRDVFASRIRESFVFTENFESSNRRQLGRFISFGVSYGFGKGEAITYNGAGRRR